MLGRCSRHSTYTLTERDLLAALKCERPDNTAVEIQGYSQHDRNAVCARTVSLSRRLAFRLPVAFWDLFGFCFLFSRQARSLKLPPSPLNTPSPLSAFPFSSKLHCSKVLEGWLSLQCLSQRLSCASNHWTPKNQTCCRGRGDLLACYMYKNSLAWVLPALPVLLSRQDRLLG